ncbi:hypothetical protein DSL64_08430 [Dyadobacter luteus]|uniref:Uncharacterized protein n=1 Tax=Dyadobacter luteus TaxID=2259619 RepID=A0A3D8YEJ3_9BACT|nr:hypothetical protein [Dyadobacter luteus]REA62926.1 hypothetical protein DSL64_08430 [Dyadobacter luteus]
MKNSRQFKTFLIAAFVAASSGAFAQVKIGSNPVVIGPNNNLEVEATNGNKTVILKDNGNVGIGTTAPGNKAEINSGTANTSGLRFTNLNDASGITTNTNTNYNLNGRILNIWKTGK